MTKRQRELLEAIERGETSTSHPSDAFVKELQQLRGSGWIELRLQKDHQSAGDHWYIAAYTLTEEGRKALAEERGRG
jgi:hypothetical protein